MFRGKGNRCFIKATASFNILYPETLAIFFIFGKSYDSPSTMN
jgi:hypothetical protein